MTGTTAYANGTPDKPITLEEILDVKARLDALPKPQWALVAPNGDLYMDDPMKLARVLLREALPPFGHSFKFDGDE